MAFVEFGVDTQAGCGDDRSDEVDDHLMAGQRSAAPVHGDVGEQSVLDRRTHKGIPCHDIIGGTLSVAMTWLRKIDGETYV